MLLVQSGQHIHLEGRLSPSHNTLIRLDTDEKPPRTNAKRLNLLDDVRLSRLEPLRIYRCAGRDRAGHWGT